MGRKHKKKDMPQVNPALEGFDIRVNELGEIISNIEITQLNEFLDTHVEDKKFKGIQVIKRNEETNQLERKSMLQSESYD